MFFTNVFTNINKVLFVTLWNLFLPDLKKCKFEAYSLSGCPGTKKECFYIIAEASHFLVRGLFQLEESRDLHHHSASFSSYFLVQASSVSSFQIRRVSQVSSGFTSSSHARCSRSGSWRACAAWFGSVLGSGDPAAFFWGSVPPRNLLPYSVPVWSPIQQWELPSPAWIRESFVSFWEAWNIVAAAPRSLDLSLGRGCSLVILQNMST